MRSTAAIGRHGEDVAAGCLEAEGWTILARNFRAGPGEIDIAAERDGILGIIEVKTWQGLGQEDLADSITLKKRRRILETTKIFLARHREYSRLRIRFDVLLVRDGRVARRFESAFTGEP